MSIALSCTSCLIESMAWPSRHIHTRGVKLCVCGSAGNAVSTTVMLGSLPLSPNTVSVILSMSPQLAFPMASVGQMCLHVNCYPNQLLWHQDWHSGLSAYLIRRTAALVCPLVSEAHPPPGLP